MAEKETTAAAKTARRKKEAVYTAEKLVAGHKAFGTSPEIVAVALRIAGLDRATRAQAAKVVEEFRHRK